MYVSRHPGEPGSQPFPHFAPEPSVPPAPSLPPAVRERSTKSQQSERGASQQREPVLQAVHSSNTVDSDSLREGGPKKKLIIC